MGKKSKFQMDKSTKIGSQVINIKDLPAEINGLAILLQNKGFSKNKQVDLIEKMSSAVCPKCKRQYDGKTLLKATVWKDEKLSQGKCVCGSKKIVLYTDMKKVFS